MEADSTFDKTLEEDNTIEGAKRVVKNQCIEKAIDQADELLKNCKLNGSTLEYIDSEEEVVVEENFVQGAAETDLEAGEVPVENAAEMAGEDDVPVDYDTEEKADGAKAQELARTVKVEFDPADIRFWFSQLEDEMLMATIGTQWLKKTVLQRNLPVKQKEDVKELLTLPKTQAGAHIYLDIKRELVRIYGPKPQESYKRAHHGRTSVSVGNADHPGHL